MKKTLLIAIGIIYVIGIIFIGVKSGKESRDRWARQAAMERMRLAQKTYPGGEAYEVQFFPQEFKSERPKNLILLIGDGMGVSQLFSGLTANHGHLFIENFKTIGFSKTQAVDTFITDSGAAGTALATGVKTYYGAIGVDKDTIPVQSILEAAEESGLATGMVVTKSITDATPASFIAHQPDRYMYEEIAADFLKTDIEVIIGGGYRYFTSREDSINLVEKLTENGYTFEREIDNLKNIESDKLLALIADSLLPRVETRKDMLPVATNTALNILNKNENGFFLMVEGSLIDQGGHVNNTIYIVEEVLDFDQAVGKALEFAAKDGETLVIVTADHETGGFAIEGGDMSTGMVKGEFIGRDHTGVIVPVFAYGPGSENFAGFMENTDVNRKMRDLLLGN